MMPFWKNIIIYIAFESDRIEDYLDDELNEILGNILKKKSRILKLKILNFKS